MSYSCFEVDKEQLDYLNVISSLYSSQYPYSTKQFNIETYNFTNPDKKTIFGCLYDLTLSDDLKTNLKRIIDDSFDYLIKNNFTNIDKNYGMIEYHKYNDFENHTIQLDRHYDDHGAVSYPVTTLIYYFNKTCEGGNLEIYNLDEDILVETINTKPSENKVKILLLDGNIPHNITPITSNGVRECIVVQFKYIGNR